MLRAEDRLQSHCTKYLTAALMGSGAFFSAIEHAKKQTLRQGQIQKAKGVKRGLPDLNIWHKGMYYGIELKVNSPISDSQAAFGAAMEANGFKWVVIWSVEQLDSYLRNEGVPLPVSARIEALRHDAALESVLPAPKAKRTGTKPRARRPSSRALAIATQSQLPGWGRS